MKITVTFTTSEISNIAELAADLGANATEIDQFINDEIKADHPMVNYYTHGGTFSMNVNEKITCKIMKKFKPIVQMAKSFFMMLVSFFEDIDDMIDVDDMVIYKNGKKVGEEETEKKAETEDKKTESENSEVFNV